jgi:hypothetical protein
MRDAGRYPACGASARVTVPTTSVSILVSDGAYELYFTRTNDFLYRHATHRKQKLNLRMIRSVKVHACGHNPRDTKNALYAESLLCVVVRTTVTGLSDLG